MSHISCVGRLLLMFMSPTRRHTHEKHHISLRNLALLGCECICSAAKCTIATTYIMGSQWLSNVFGRKRRVAGVLLSEAASRNARGGGRILTPSYSEVKSPTDTSPEPHFFLTQTAGKFLSLSKAPFSIMAKGLC